MSDIEECLRSRKPTEKGCAYKMDVKTKTITRLFRQLQRAYENKNIIMRTGTCSKEQIETVRTQYARWLEDYEYDELFETRFELEGILTIEADIVNFKRERIAQDDVLKIMKTEVEDYVLESKAYSQQAEELAIDNEKCCIRLQQQIYCEPNFIRTVKGKTKKSRNNCEKLCT